MDNTMTTPLHQLPQHQPIRRRIRRRRPNVLITGTPGTGKTTLAALIVERLNDISSTSTTASNTTSNDTVPAAVAVGGVGVPQHHPKNTTTSTTGSTARIIIAKHVNVGEIIAQQEMYDADEPYDTELDTNVVDDDKLIDYLDELFVETLDTSNKNESNDDYDNNDTDDNTYISLIADYHINDIFPQRYFDLIIVLRSTTETLYDRYTVRNYSPNKINQNITSEIMNVVHEEAVLAYDPNMVQEVPSNTIHDMESNVQRIVDWIQLYMNNDNHDE